MNKTAIKNFAIWARNKLIADICYRAGLMGITEKGIADALPQSTREAEFYDFGATEPYMLDGDAIKQRRQLVSAIREKEADTDYATAYQYIMEEVAYTWFNRLIAVRFMEVNDYLPSHLRVLSSESGKVEPDLVTTPFDADLPFTAEEEARIIQWKQDNKLDELTPEVEEKDVTVRKADLQRDIKSLLSYAVGCMFGRYSLDVPGLVLAGQSFEEKFVHASNAVTGTGVLGAPGLLRAPGALYLRTEEGVKQCTFAPDVDNVIPITDEEYLEDDIIARLCDWLKVVYGAATLEANLDYIAKALGNKGTTSREVIRNYFVNDFFKDHCQTYSVTGSGKRPIYWLFDSGKQNGFKALVYLHRYTPDTIGTLRVDYLHKMQRVYESEINRMQDMMDHTTNAREAAVASKRKDKLTKQLKECRDYDEKISHLALSRIALDLDDGVKVNYRKLQTAADGKFYEVLADSKNIMAKEKK